MDRDVLTACLLILLLGIGCEGGIESGSDGGSGSEDPADPDSATFSPAGASASIALNAAVTVTFSATITEPSDWTSVLTLKKDGAGDSLCTAVNYDSVSRVATCVHSELDGSRNYTAALSGLSGVTDATATFTTGPEIVVTMGKTSVASTSSGHDVTLTFNFASRLPGDWTPGVSVIDANGEALAVGGCAFNGGRTSYSCTAGGIDGCTTFSDYTVTVTGTGGFTTTFNSADDEFDNNGTLGACWVQEVLEGTATITDGNFRVSIPGDASGNGFAYYKDISLADNYAFLTNISSVEYPTSGSGFDKPQICSGPYSAGNADHVHTCLSFGGMGQIWWIARKNVAVLTSAPTGDFGPPGPAALPFYACLVRHDNVIKTYVSFDGSSFTQLTGSNMSVAVGPGTAEEVVETGGSWADLVSLNGVNGFPGTTIAGEYDYVRFKTTGITGESSDDCPAL